MRSLARFVYAVEERIQRIKILLRDRIELVVVAARTLEGLREEGCAHCVHAIHHVGDSKFLLDRAAFLRLHVVSIKCRRQYLVLRRVRQQVSGELPRYKSVVGQILVERLDHPIAPRPHRAITICLVTESVGITGEIEPIDRHPFTEGLRFQEFVDDLLVSVL